MEAFLLQLLIWAGPIGLFGGFILLMVKKYEWKWPQLITAGLFALLVASAVPDLPQATNDGVTGFVTAFTDSK